MIEEDDRDELIADPFKVTADDAIEQKKIQQYMKKKVANLAAKGPRDDAYSHQPAPSTPKEQETITGKR